MKKSHGLTKKKKLMIISGLLGKELAAMDAGIIKPNWNGRKDMIALKDEIDELIEEIEAGEN